MNRDVDFLFALITGEIKKDPVKLDNMRAESEWMFNHPENIPEPDDTLELYMAESAMHWIKTENPHIPELAEAINTHSTELEAKLVQHLIETKAALCTEYYLNGSCIHSEHTA